MNRLDDLVVGWWWGHGLSTKMMYLPDAAWGDVHSTAQGRFPETQVFSFAEPNVLVPIHQMLAAMTVASDGEGPVVPFTTRRVLSSAMTDVIRDGYNDLPRKALAEWWALYPENPRSIFGLSAEVEFSEASRERRTYAVRRDAEMGRPVRWIPGPAVQLSAQTV